MQEETKHSPTPWVQSGEEWRTAKDAEGFRIFQMLSGSHYAEMDLAYILKCVNSHEALVKAMENISYHLSIICALYPENAPLRERIETAHLESSQALATYKGE